MYCKSSISWTSALSSEQTVSSCNLKIHKVNKLFHQILPDRYEHTCEIIHFNSRRMFHHLRRTFPDIEIKALARRRLNITVLCHPHAENGARKPVMILQDASTFCDWLCPRFAKCSCYPSCGRSLVICSTQPCSHGLLTPWGHCCSFPAGPGPGKISEHTDGTGHHCSEPQPFLLHISLSTQDEV